MKAALKNKAKNEEKSGYVSTNGSKVSGFFVNLLY
jgi:hypothetical protein